MRRSWPAGSTPRWPPTPWRTSDGPSRPDRAAHPLVADGAFDTPPNVRRADEFFVNGVRLPYQARGCRPLKSPLSKGIEYTRECLALEVGRGLTARAVIAVLAGVV